MRARSASAAVADCDLTAPDEAADPRLMSMVGGGSGGYSAGGFVVVDPSREDSYPVKVQSRDSLRVGLIWCMYDRRRIEVEGRKVVMPARHVGRRKLDQ